MEKVKIFVWSYWVRDNTHISENNAVSLRNVLKNKHENSIKSMHTCDQTQYRRDLPILGPQIRVAPDRPKLLICMNSDFSLLPKAKTWFTDHRRCLLYLNLQQEAAIDLLWFSATGKYVYRLKSVNKNQHFFRHLIGCSDCICTN